MTQEKTYPISKSPYLWIMLLGLLLAAILYCNSLGTFQVGVYMDDASYVALARGLANEGVYGYTNVPGEVNITRYPFGFPLLLTPLAKLFPESLSVLQLVSLISTLINGWLLYIAGTHFGWGHRPVLRLFIPLLYLFAPLVSGHAIMVMSEAVFTLWVLLTLLLLSAILSSDKLSWIYPVLLSVVVFTAATTRTLGYPLIIIVMGSLVVAKKYRQLILFSVGLVTIFMMTWVALPIRWQDFGLSTEYRQQLYESRHYEPVLEGSDLVVRVVSLLWVYLIEGVYSAIVSIGGVGPASQAFFGKWGLSFIPTILGLVISGLVAMGMIRSYRSYPVPLVFTVVYCGALLFWPFYSARFLYPVLPFLYYYLLDSMESIIGVILSFLPNLNDEKRSKVVPFAVAMISSVLLLANVLRSLPRDTSLNHTLDLREGTYWLKDNVTSDTVVMSEQALTAFIYVNRRVVDYPSNPADLLNQIDRYGVDYLLIRPKLQWTSPRTLELSNLAQGTLNYVESKPDIFTSSHLTLFGNG